jgi:hypothetical protein
VPNELEKLKAIIMKNNFVKWIQDGIVHRRVAIYLKVIAILMFLSALTHLSSIMGIIGGSWMDKPVPFRIADLLLLPIGLILTWGLWKSKFWSVIVWFTAVVFFQVIPFLFFGEVFASNAEEQTMLYGQVGFHAITFVIFFVLLPRVKKN